ncbi:hypothetical protein ROHU_021524 [Labeo rohita]|nr:hypothetical protein ROHU_021524 [Labeo rohita]
MDRAELTPSAQHRRRHRPATFEQSGTSCSLQLSPAKSTSSNLNSSVQSIGQSEPGPPHSIFTARANSKSLGIRPPAGKPQQKALSKPGPRPRLRSR